MRIAVQFRKPPHEVAAWTSEELDLVEAFLAREPSADARVEIAVARLCEMFATAWSNPRSGVKFNVKDFLPYLDAWKAVADDKRYSDTDRETFKALGLTK